MEQTVVGADIQVGQKAPNFTIQKNDWTLSKGLRETKRKVRIILSVPSLDTAVCDRETRRFNEEAANLGKGIAVLVVSMDLAAAQRRWCGAAGIERVITVSDASKKEIRLLRRAAFVVNKKGIVTYAAYMPTNKDEPDYEEVLSAAKAALA
jgi:thiol peroxidase